MLSKTLNVDFIITDQDDIVEVLINDEYQEFALSNTVVISKKFTFKEGRNLITVVAIDDKGNKTKEQYIVAFGKGVSILPEGAEKKKSKFNWNVSLGAKLENDSNPSDDLGVPIDTGDIVIEGIVPDEEQPDTRTTKNATLSFSYDKFSGFLGINTTEYSQQRYKNNYDTSITMAGLGYQPGSKEWGTVIKYMFMDINTDGYDTLQSHTVTLGYQFGYVADNGSNSKQKLLLVNAKSEYADPNTIPSSTGTFRWEYDNMDKEGLDYFRYVMAVGSSLEGDEEQKNTFTTFDFLWNNKWLSGVLFDIGFGFGHKPYPNQMPLSSNTPLGDTRVDVPLKFNTGLGYTLYGWKLKWNYDYSFNLSNKKPTVRVISGFELSGSF
ncbi:MAG: hypothetical protein HQ517_00100 [SAR324 cluster bacterium]|nr:hypothetical protein [SAR324 cluster bacterium]